jgi:hypothetical protein
MIKEDIILDEKTNWSKVIIFFALVGLFILSIYYHKNERDTYGDSFKGESIALSTRFKHGRRVTYLQYYFYVDKKIISKVFVNNNDSAALNKFYKVKYDLNNPEKENYIMVEEELKPDSLTLVKAGFTKTKYYIYDGGVTCKYIEKSKWK